MGWRDEGLSDAEKDEIERKAREETAAAARKIKEDAEIEAQAERDRRNSK